MRIVCGTDFSDRADQAAEVGALLAHRTGGDLTLVHVLDTRGSLFGPGGLLDAIDEAARERLAALADTLRALGARVSTELPAGWPDEALVAEAVRRDGAWLVLPAVGVRDGAGVRLGKTCERTLRQAQSPMLVLRDASPLLAWLRDERPLRLLVAYDFTPQADAAVLCAGQLAALGACQPVAAYIGDPRREAARMGLHEAPAEARQRLRDEIARRLARAFPALPIEVVVSAEEGDAATQLARLAERERADLIVSGSHQRGTIERLFSGSVALGLMREASTNVLVAPGAALAVVTGLPPVVRRILAATDLSPLGNQALAYALAIAPPNGEVVLVHVVSPNLMLHGQYGRASYARFDLEHAEVLARRRAALHELVAQAGAGDRSVRIELVEHEHPERALIEAIEREAPDLVCVGTLGRTGASAVILGSTAQVLLRRCRRPLLMIQPQDR